MKFRIWIFDVMQPALGYNSITSQLHFSLFIAQNNLTSDLLSALQLYFKPVALGNFLQTNPKSLHHLIIPFLIWQILFFAFYVCWLATYLNVNNGLVCFCLFIISTDSFAIILEGIICSIIIICKWMNYDVRNKHDLSEGSCLEEKPGWGGESRKWIKGLLL